MPCVPERTFRQLHSLEAGHAELNVQSNYFLYGKPKVPINSDVVLVQIVGLGGICCCFVVY